MRRKHPDPELSLFGSMPVSDLPDELLLRSVYRINALKGLYRQGWLKRDLCEARCESVADHSFSCAMLVLLLAGRPPFEQLDRDKCLRMALIHELGEVYAGDITPVDGISLEEKHRMEEESLAKVLDGLSVAGELTELWEEFEAGTSAEARFLRQIDRLELGFQAALLKAEKNPEMDEFLDSARKAVQDPYLASMLETVRGLSGD